jgi:hypothetical protein
MDKRTYSLSVGVILLITSIAFFLIPAFIRLDSLIPVMIALICFVVALVFFFAGRDE